jgi:hypothetical protein
MKVVLSIPATWMFERFCSATMLSQGAHGRPADSHDQ